MILIWYNNWYLKNHVQDSKKRPIARQSLCLASSKDRGIFRVTDHLLKGYIIHSFGSGEHLVVRDFSLGRKPDVWVFWVLSPKKSSFEPIEHLEKNQAFPEKSQSFLRTRHTLGLDNYEILPGVGGGARINNKTARVFETKFRMGRRLYVLNSSKKFLPLYHWLRPLPYRKKKQNKQQALQGLELVGLF